MAERRMLSLLLVTLSAACANVAPMAAAPIAPQAANPLTGVALTQGQALYDATMCDNGPAISRYTLTVDEREICLVVEARTEEGSSGAGAYRVTTDGGSTATFAVTPQSERAVVNACALDGSERTSIVAETLRGCVANEGVVTPLSRELALVAVGASRRAAFVADWALAANP